MSTALTEAATGGASDVSSPSPATSSNTASPTGDPSINGQASVNENSSKSSANPTSANPSHKVDNVPDVTITSTQPSGSGQSSSGISSFDSLSASQSASESVSRSASIAAVYASASARLAALATGPAVQNETSESAYNPSVAGWPFNSTVTFTLKSSSPMLNLDRNTQSPFGLDPETGYRTYAQYFPADFTVNFVGVGYTINGVSTLGSTLVGQSAPNPVLNQLYKMPLSEKVMREYWAPGEENLGAMSDLDLRMYQVEAGWNSGANITFRNATIEIPIRTQA